MKFQKISLVLILVLMLVPCVSAQDIYLDNVTGLYNTDTLEVNTSPVFNIRITNNTASAYGGITNGFRVFSPDGATWTQTIPDTTVQGWEDYFDLIFNVININVDGVGADTVGYGGSRIFSTGIPIGFDDIAFTIQIGPIDASAHRKTICIDSSFYPPSGLWKWASPDAIPTWGGQHCYKVFDPNAPAESNISTTSDSLYFTVVEDDPAPDLQTFDVLSDNLPVGFTVTESTGWIVATPTTGTTDQTVTVQINNTGLTVGTYVDSIEVASGTAVNGPLWVKVVLDVTPKPAEIGFTPSQIVFNAVAAGANPADKILTILNLGGLPLNWSLSNTESWLSLSDYSGTDSTDVFVSADITGLAFGEYDDTIVISDPNAINDPQYVPVHLSVASDLPLIEMDSTYYTLVSTPNNATPPTKLMTVLNGGAGVMNYEMVETSSWIDSIVPATGSAPQQVEVFFDLTGTTAGQTIYDTITVNSAEAVNSPQIVEIEIHIANTPAQILLNTDTAFLNVYECSFGLQPKDQAIFSIDNITGGEPMDYDIVFESSLFSLNVVPKTNWDEVTITAKNDSLPVGIYYDTIAVVSQYAANSPQYMQVKYTVQPTFYTPSVFILNDNLYLKSQAGEGPLPRKDLLVFNSNPGCMEWYAEEDIDYLTFVSDSGNVTDALSFYCDVSGYARGIYNDTVWVNAPAAGNSPYPVSIEMIVWTHHGDFNFDGVLDIVDIMLYLEYMFNYGDGPYPELRVADLNCDGLVDLPDLLYFVEYAFNNGPKPCGNP